MGILIMSASGISIFQSRESVGKGVGKGVGTFLDSADTSRE